ncbi:MAG: hypothetical protein IJ071_05560 [Ruminococcus sp.]|nr:hypothetical protein [Ruminococcus sp.]
MDLKKTLAAVCAASLLSTGAFTGAVSAEEKTPHLLDVSQFVVQDENMVYIGASYLRDASYLFDEQDKVPESAESPTVSSEVLKETSKANWTPNQQMAYGPAQFYIDMGANYVITGIAFLDTNGTPTWTVSDGEPFAWNDIATVNMDSYNWWRAVTFDDPKPTRYLHFSSDYCDSGVSELAIYGYKESELSSDQIKKTSAKSKEITIPTRLDAGKAFGFNAFIDDPMTSIMAAGNVREYHNLSWLIDSSGKVKFTQGTWGDMDSYYTAMKEQDIDIIPCFQGGNAYIYGEDKYPEIAAPKDADTLDPKSYMIHAQAMYQVAARYGSNKDIDLSTLNITDAQEPKVGMGLLTALENSNEPNKNWSGKASYYTPYELAAMCSADYDGHEGTIPNAGVKAADPEFKLAMGGLVGYSTIIQYLDQMKQWFDYNRKDGQFAVDIINVHIGAGSNPIEDSSLGETVHKLKEWINENAPGTELWISEFEVPMTDCEVEGVDDHDNEEYQLRYAERVARTYLTAYAAGADRITKFQLRDEGEGVYYNSGLVGQKGSWKKKLAWYYLSCMNSVLEGTVYPGVYKKSSDLCQMEFYKMAGDTVREDIECIYYPTNTGKIGKETISAGSYSYAYLTVPEMGIAEGKTTELAVKDGKVTVEVSETPVFVTFTNSPKTVLNGRNSMIRPSLIAMNEDKSGETCDLTAAPKDSALDQFYRMFDEPDTMPDPIYGDTDGMETPSTNSNQSNAVEYAFFDKEYVFNGFAVYDTYGTGGISVYDAHTDELLWSSDLGGYMYRAVTLTADSAPTDCLRIERKGGDMNELALYGYEAPERHDWDVDKNGVWNTFDLILMRQEVAEDTGNYNTSDLIGLGDFLLGRTK